MNIDVFFTPFFPETELMFNGKYVVMIDILRASTTVCAALSNGAKEIIFSDSVDKAVNIYNSLSKESRILGGERNGIRPDGFNAGNSPSEYSSQLVKGKSVIISTTNGTKIFAKAKESKKKFVGAFVNLNSLLNTLNQDYSNSQFSDLIFICAGTNGRFTYEDSLCAGAFIDALGNQIENIKLTDAAQGAKDLFTLYKHNFVNFLKQCEHASYLANIGFESDVEECLNTDYYPVIPVISGNSIKLLED